MGVEPRTAMEVKGTVLMEVKRAFVLTWRSKEHGDELLTPLAVRELWNISGASVRKAIGVGNVDVPLEVWLTDRPVSLIRLQSACAFWGEPDEEKVAEMRGNGFNLPQGDGWNILHPKPVIAMACDPEGVGPGELRGGVRV